jgi:hypothetical protein
MTEFVIADNPLFYLCSRSQTVEGDPVSVRAAGRAAAGQKKKRPAGDVPAERRLDDAAVGGSGHPPKIFMA